jgi:hypothetical protein
MLFGKVLGLAVSDAAVQGNWMSPRLIERIRRAKPELFKLQTSGQEQAAYHDGIELRSSGQCIDLTCRADQTRPACRHRFHIVSNKEDRFDMLLGSDIAHTTKKSGAPK